jgi:hypothetical protein
MSEKEDVFRKHPIHTTLDNISSALESDAFRTEDPTVTDLVDRVRESVSYTRSSLSYTVPSLINRVLLKQSNNLLQTILNEINAYSSNKNIAHLNNTTNHIDGLISNVVSFPVPKFVADDEYFSSSYASFKSKAEEVIESIALKRSELEEMVLETAQKAEETSKRSDELKSTIEAEKAKIQQISIDFKNQLETAATTHQASLQGAINEFSNKNDAQSKELVAKFEALQKSFSEQNKQFTDKLSIQANKLVETLEEKKREASDLVQIIGNIGITGNYQKNANQEKESADTWRQYAILLMLGMVFAVSATIFVSLDNDFDWKMVVFRLMATFILVIPAAYAARESSRHRTLENLNRKAELELASLDPYLEKLPEEKRHAIKEKLTEKFFGLNPSQIQNDQQVSATSLLEIIKLAVKGK